MLNNDRREEWITFIRSQYPDIDPWTVRLMDELRMVSHLLYQIGENSVAPADLSYAQMRILMTLFVTERGGQTDGLNPSEISQYSGTSRNTISALIRTLEDEGYVERRLDDQDRRKFNISLTDEGRQLVLGNVGRHLLIVNEIFRALSPEEMEQMSAQLHKLNDRALAFKERHASAAGGTHAISR